MRGAESLHEPRIIEQAMRRVGINEFQGSLSNFEKSRGG